MDRARATLRDYRTTLVTGPPGSGRSATAKQLLYEQRGTGGRFVRLSDRPEEGGSRVLHPDDVQNADLMLLDLTAADQGVVNQVQREMPEFRAAVQKHNAYLTVALPPDTALQAEMNDLHTSIERPPAFRVLRKHLRAGGIIVETAELATPDLAEFLAQAHMREVAQFADLIHQYRDRGPGHFHEWLRRALSVTTERRDEVRKAVARLPAAKRALLFACALLHGSRGHVVHRAAAELLRVAAETHAVQAPLSRAALSVRLKEVGAEMTTDGRVTFRALRYDEAVGDSLWDDFPDLLPALSPWVDGLVRAPDLEDRERADLVHRYARQCLRTDRPGELSDAAVAWMAQDTPNWLNRAAYTALSDGLSHEQHGGHFRARVYEWSTNRQLSPGLVRVLVGVCADVMAVQHPDSALVRLLHLARREPRTTECAARDALFRLAFSERRLTRRLLDRVHRAWASPLSRWQRIRVSELFLHLADPGHFCDASGRARPLIAETAVQAQLTAGWRATFALRPFAECGSRVADWLRTAREEASPRDALLDVLVASCVADGDLLGHLYTTDWHLARSGEDGESAAQVSELLWNKINAAQGLGA
ncbi:hypothetical protein ACH4FX_27210 [Streptomyces sp. NPDC018019]|uniref:hypothetical protein n=1 Tax=Streptomyces sp. NPDC018019 TaxID=3365030 RepID=UPI0037BA4B21